MGRIIPNLIKIQNSRRWNKTTIECFQRNCICLGCDIVPEEFQEHCCVKNFVLQTYVKLGKPYFI